MIPDPPYSPYTSMIPILFVVIVTAVKQVIIIFLCYRIKYELINKLILMIKKQNYAILKENIYKYIK